ncbi:MAG: dTDP-4-dehydrorhamnose reductase [Candidatus Diapherotrites archaeon ADurb.Bin253]|nr:MAG: dTDP-4-dehydrorhamnose reductase [Candidatus Diapherotrites archaeon ADurb.Bin253]
MILEDKILFTGGSGLLGREIKKLIPNAYFPSHQEFDIENYSQMKEYLKGKEINQIIHAAAFTSPPKLEKDPIKGIDTNIIGTSNVVKLAFENNSKLIYISTDYVFSGEKGNYSEEDALYPVNKYAWSKLGGECAVRMYDNSLIIRTSFGPNEFPYEKAFIDQWTSRESVSEISKKIINLLNKDVFGIIHLGGPRRTVFEYAKSLDKSKDIGKRSIKEMEFNFPKDTSLDSKKYNLLMGEIK